jgi:hypothetical protein
MESRSAKELSRSVIYGEISYVMKAGRFSPLTLKVALSGLIVFCAMLAAAGAVFATTVEKDDPAGAVSHATGPGG